MFVKSFIATTLVVAGFSAAQAADTITVPVMALDGNLTVSSTLTVQCAGSVNCKTDSEFVHMLAQSESMTTPAAENECLQYEGDICEARVVNASEEVEVAYASKVEAAAVVNGFVTKVNDAFNATFEESYGTVYLDEKDDEFYPVVAQGEAVQSMQMLETIRLQSPKVLVEDGKVAKFSFVLKVDFSQFVEFESLLANASQEEFDGAVRQEISASLLRQLAAGVATSGKCFGYNKSGVCVVEILALTQNSEFFENEEEAAAVVEASQAEYLAAIKLFPVPQGWVNEDLS